ncbi:MAG: saccharopine dehydrogenase family protein [Epsilonproteobacteria bacterium]|nr:saccharopine dehydrogenase family protein [Campylobacterota bacterium]OIO13970.1 MAG: saccharopine dehydrogenase [Helicobacteraceae bacterium CG1_02_36_14]PIP10092.1 MAG: saccharopine dehydrogenase [Sulfurimonas sp. CG23_combo_of_CG06-09_8_20_14_all_36_33]PIS26634.1 MAG: saccharopine dehydrogenase [Sulfurimonas sp. CG08_land_8_20_14_0_20_36_33]PIU33453.1 MAG: saccharopine dehydrogenase [Sulfurimonas sp. CG07_land_8_20_14_0_80_36_56]PIV05639.1 MAG: saccharopine dehydrogenase [Sulfurimonas sp
MKTTLIIGAGGVSRVVVHKCVQNADVFGKIVLASRSIGRCEAIKSELPHANIEITTVDADDTQAVIKLISTCQADIVINVALPYQDLTIMDACIATKTPYLDTANYEHPDEAKFEYKLQWERDEKFKEAGIMGLLGSGFDPGATNMFCAYAQKHYFDEIHTIDILDCNAGDHGYPFATNFNPEINLREVSSKGRYWENGEWIETEPMEIMQVWDYPEVGPKDSYLLYHEEMESLVKHIKGLKRIRFFMTFGQSYLTHMKCLENVGMLGIEPVEHKGMKIVPMEFLATLLPDPASLGPRTKGKTNIGIVAEGIKDGKKRKIYIYQVKDHEECYAEVKSQGVSYTTGVPAMIGAKLMLKGIWSGQGVFNIEQLDPDPFMEEMMTQGLPWQIKELDV